MFIFGLSLRMLFADFLFFLYLLILPLSCWGKRDALLREGNSWNRRRLRDTANFASSWIYRALHQDKSLFQFKNISISLMLTLPLSPPSSEPPVPIGTPSTLLNICEKFRASLVLGKLWNT